MAPGRVGVGKIIHTDRKSFMRQENRFKKAAFGRRMSQKNVVPENVMTKDEAAGKS
jgi:hypothetical protein